jgi:hypothetical protein
MTLPPMADGEPATMVRGFRCRCEPACFRVCMNCIGFYASCCFSLLLTRGHRPAVTPLAGNLMVALLHYTNGLKRLRSLLCRQHTTSKYNLLTRIYVVTSMYI